MPFQIKEEELSEDLSRTVGLLREKEKSEDLFCSVTQVAKLKC